MPRRRNWGGAGTTHRDRFGVGSSVWNVGFVSLRQAATPTPMLGRMNSVMLTLLGGVVPVGALAGGLLATLWVVFSPVRTIRELPNNAE